jgi:hypothetical protein
LAVAHPFLVFGYQKYHDDNWFSTWEKAGTFSAGRRSDQESARKKSFDMAVSLGDLKKE